MKMNRIWYKLALSIGVFACLALYTVPARAVAVRSIVPANTLPRNDDGSTALVGIGFNVNFYGFSSTQLYVNNNGNVTFTGPLATFTPFGLAGTNTRIIAPFFGDVDTRNLASDVVRYGTSTVDGRNAFVVNYVGVGYYNTAANRLNDFQLVLIDRSDTGAGNFDIEFNYDRIQWETGDASGGTGGLGGSSARVGYSNGAAGAANVSFELFGSAINGAFLDTGPASTRLISNSLNSNVAGRYVFNVREGGVVDPVPEPATMILLGTGLAGVAVGVRRRRNSRHND